ncbi:MAG: hypothetical protein JO065_13570 [Acidobacteria bacterium]|nr:hypothetical protein [Acidobacteriota bacterium]
MPGAVAHGQSTPLPCPGYNPINNTNLACELATGFRAPANITAGNTTTASGQSFNPVVLSATLATQLSSLPVATAVSGTGITFVNGIPTFSAESLGTILTQRGETIGKHRFFVSFNYQRFGFGSIDGARFKNLATVNQVTYPGVGTSYVVGANNIDFRVDQYTALATFGISSRLDLTLVVPFSTVNLSLVSNAHQYNVDNNGNPLSDFSLGAINLPGSKSGPGDVTVSLKGNVFRAENGFSMAVGSELRIPTGDETNYLGTGAYGVKPYAILSHRGKHFTPNLNIGYQWNSASALYTNPKGDHLNLPPSFLYSGGVDYRISRRLTLVGEFVGQHVIDGPRLQQSTVKIPGQGSFASIVVTDSTGNQLTSSYDIANAGGGIKINPFGGLLITASGLFKLNDAGLRAKWVPLVGISYRF